MIFIFLNYLNIYFKFKIWGDGTQGQQSFLYIQLFPLCLPVARNLTGPVWHCIADFCSRGFPPTHHRLLAGRWDAYTSHLPFHFHISFLLPLPKPKSALPPSSPPHLIHLFSELLVCIYSSLITMVSSSLDLSWYPVFYFLDSLHPIS